MEFLNWKDTIYFTGNTYVSDLEEIEENYKEKIEKLALEWEYQDLVEEYINLEKGYIEYLAVFLHVPTNTFYGAGIIVSYEGFEEEDLVWKKLGYTERTIKDYYVIENKNAENTEK
jgi:hypothetical protein